MIVEETLREPEKKTTLGGPAHMIALAGGNH